MLLVCGKKCNLAVQPVVMDRKGNECESISASSVVSCRAFGGDALVVDLSGLWPLLVPPVRAPLVAITRQVILLQTRLFTRCMTISQSDSKKCSSVRTDLLSEKHAENSENEPIPGESSELNYPSGQKVSVSDMRKGDLSGRDEEEKR